MDHPLKIWTRFDDKRKAILGPTLLVNQGLSVYYWIAGWAPT